MIRFYHRRPYDYDSKVNLQRSFHGPFLINIKSINNIITGYDIYVNFQILVQTLINMANHKCLKP